MFQLLDDNDSDYVDVVSVSLMASLHLCHIVIDSLIIVYALLLLLSEYLFIESGKLASINRVLGLSHS